MQASCPLGAMLSRLHSGDVVIDRDAKRWEMRADRVGDVGRRKVRIVLFRHARVGMAKLFGNDAHRNTLHGECRAVGMAKHMERDFRLDLRSPASFPHRPQLVRLSPHATVGAGENRIAAKLARCQVSE